MKKLISLGLEAKWSNYNWREAQAFLLRDGREVGMEVNTNNQSKIIIIY
jgi:hypothetical protein